jgi:hypothetical protein
MPSPQVVDSAPSLRYNIADTLTEVALAAEKVGSCPRDARGTG